METKPERTLDDLLRELDAYRANLDRVLGLAPIVLTGRQLHLMLNGKERVKNKWWNEARRRLEKSGL